MSDILSLAAGLLLVAVLYFYFQQVRQGESEPNWATWFIWAIVSWLNRFTYLEVVEENTIRAFIALVSAIGLTTIFVYSLLKRSFDRPTWSEIIAFALAIVAAVIWKVYSNTTVAHLYLQPALLISFVPTIVGLKKGKKEKGRPWNLAVCAYTLQVLAIVFDWSSGGWIALVFPVLNGIIGNGSVALIIHSSRKGST